ncbi:MAG: efflux RND transporter periplasmic adaptor subunit [Acidobacteriota bacterium]
MSGRAAAMFLSLVGLGLTLACSSAGADVPVAPVKSGEFIAQLIQNGELRASKTEAISSPTWGKISDMVPEGAAVKEGDPVVWIETDEVEQEVKRNAFDLEVAKTNLKKAEEQTRLSGVSTQLSLEEAKAQASFRTVSLERADDTLKKREALAKEGLVSKADLESAQIAAMEARLALETANVALAKVQEENQSKGKTSGLDLDNAKANLEKAQKQYDMSKQRLDNAIVKTTKGGIVVYKKNWRGEKVKVGDQVWMGNALVEIPDLSAMEAILQVNEVDISRVKAGQEVALTVEAVPGLALTGKIASVANLAKELPGAKEGEPSGIRAFEVIATINERDERLKPGMSVVAQVITGHETASLTIPRLAVFERDGKTVAFVKKRLGYEARPVELGEHNSHEVVVKDGLKPGEQVCLLDPETGAGKPAKPGPKADRPAPAGPATGPGSAARIAPAS